MIFRVNPHPYVTGWPRLIFAYIRFVKKKKKKKNFGRKFLKFFNELLFEMFFQWLPLDTSLQVQLKILFWNDRKIKMKIEVKQSKISNFSGVKILFLVDLFLKYLIWLRFLCQVIAYFSLNQLYIIRSCLKPISKFVLTLPKGEKILKTSSCHYTYLRTLVMTGY